MNTVIEAEPALREEILAVEARRQAALLAGDLDALDELFEDNLVHMHAPGLTHRKDQLLEHVRTRQAYLGMERGELLVRVAGDVAVVTGELVNRLRKPGGGERTVAGVVTQVLHRGEDGAWRFISFQMTPYGEHVWAATSAEQAQVDSRGGQEATA
ncbi:MAG: nuclear transport factor 2 family protein [Arthrobacter sp.]|jgi:ketosteroid isomerase-like protein|nr:nuclear transport factor 2 family protein [Arthrobacter sp.]